MMADGRHPTRKLLPDDNDPCPICLCSFDRADVFSELQFPFRGPDRRRGFASERYGGQYRYSYACHIRIITRTGGRNDEKRVKKKKKRERKTFRNILVRSSTNHHVLRAQPSRWVFLKDRVRFLLWRRHIVTANRGSIKKNRCWLSIWHAYSFYPRVSFDYVSFRTTRSVCVDTPLDLRAVVCSCKVVVQARVVTNTRCVVELPNISRTRQKGLFLFLLYFILFFSFCSRYLGLFPYVDVPPFCRVYEWVNFCFIVIGILWLKGSLRFFLSIFLIRNSIK